MIMEILGNDVSIPTLQHMLKNDINTDHWKDVSCELVRGLSELHARGLLHNDMHAGNIILRQRRYVKIIDYGKSTLIDDPVIYSL